MLLCCLYAHVVLEKMKLDTHDSLSCLQISRALFFSAMAGVIQLPALFPPGLYWSVDKFQRLVIVDQLRGVCPHWQRFRVYLDQSDASVTVLRHQEWQKQTGEPFPSYETLYDMGMAMYELCRKHAPAGAEQAHGCDTARQYLAEYTQLLVSDLEEFQQQMESSMTDPIVDNVSSLLHACGLFPFPSDDAISSFPYVACLDQKENNPPTAEQPEDTQSVCSSSSFTSRSCCKTSSISSTSSSDKDSSYSSVGPGSLLSRTHPQKGDLVVVYPSSRRFILRVIRQCLYE